MFSKGFLYKVVKSRDSGIVLAVNFYYGGKCTIQDKTFTTLSRLLKTPLYKPFENIVGKGENAGNHHFLLFPTMFSAHLKTNFSFSVTFMMSSAYAFSFDQSKILSFGKERPQNHDF